MQLRRLASQSGFTLIELVIIMMVVGIIASVATMNLSETVDSAQYEQTKKELDALAIAIAGDPAAYSSGAQADFGYVGDVGSLPPSLTDLVTNPGYATWDGPYIEIGNSPNDYRTDAWGAAYVYTDTLLRSTGSGSQIDKLIASSKADLLANTVSGVLTDASMAVPGQIYKDSVTIQLLHADGAGGIKIDSTKPSRSGAFSFNNIPVGHHMLQVIYRPANDTMFMPVTVYPRHTAKMSVVTPADLW